MVCFFFFVKQKTAYEMRISDWSSDVCSSDLPHIGHDTGPFQRRGCFEECVGGRKSPDADSGTIEKKFERASRAIIVVDHIDDRVTRHRITPVGPSLAR